ncbi:MAG: PspA/IM30 family protein [Candidatus Niameybacter stercoravium]|nr:PspA/IM30 family protein [Candidatus Niameybacter stercoravium]
MSFFSRLGNIISGKANKALDKIEDPIEQIDLAIRKREEAINKAKLESASFIGSISQKKTEVSTIQEKIKQYEEGIRKALAAGDEEKATTFLLKKKEFDQEVAGLEATIKTLQTTADKVKTNVAALEKEVKELKTKKSELSARYATAKAQSKVNEILTEVNKESHISLSDIEQKVMEAESYAQGLEEFKRPDVDAELSEYLSDNKDASIQDELNKYR